MPGRPRPPPNRTRPRRRRHPLWPTGPGDAPRRLETESAPGLWGLFEFPYIAALPEDDASVSSTLPISRDGLYDIRLGLPWGATGSAKTRRRLSRSSVAARAARWSLRPSASSASAN